MIVNTCKRKNVLKKDIELLNIKLPEKLWTGSKTGLIVSTITWVEVKFIW